jgi:hypothetical protein
MPGGALIDSPHRRSQDPNGFWFLRVNIALIAGLAMGWLAFGATVSRAHEGGEFGVEVLAERVPPGAGLPLRGAEWQANSVLSVRIRAGTSSFVELSAIRTDNDGHFETTVPLPGDLPAGPATIEVASPNGVIASAVVTVDPDSPAPSGFAQTAGAVDPESVGFDPFSLLALLALGTTGVVLALRARGRGAH